MSTPATGLLSTVVETLDAHATTWQPLADDALTFRLAGSGGLHHFVVTTDDATGIVTLYVPFGPYVPDLRRVAVAEAIARVNRALGVGHFELDFDSGELRFRATIDVEGGLFVQTMADNLIRAALWSCDHYLPALLAVAFGDVEPVVAVAALDAPAASDAADDDA